MKLPVGTRVVSTVGQARGECSGVMLIREIQIYVSGAGRIAIGMKQTSVIFMKKREGGWSALKIFTRMTRDLYVMDIFE